MPKSLTLPCLSVQQPFADLICSGVKTVENRSWNTKHRGTILIHASETVKPKKAFNLAMSNPAFYINHDDKFGDQKKEDFNYQEIIKDVNAFRQLAMLVKWMEADGNPNIPPMRTGAIVGAVDIIDVIPPQENIDNPWAIEGSYKWILSEPEFFQKPLLHRKGKLKLYNEKVDSDLKTIDLLEWFLKVMPEKTKRVKLSKGE